jgi:hypothetical protein
MGIQVGSIKGQGSLQRVDNYKNVKNGTDSFKKP